MFSRRTSVLLLLAIVSVIATGWVWKERQPRCAETRQSFSRRAPIPGASGRDTFLCQAMYEGMPLRDKVIVVSSLFAVLAVLRSIAVDVHAHGIRRRELPD